ncbi:Threonylcarbamoyl-AMP synthase [Gimesia panareensis]|uniref:Threonylcarbamoyl-AMP synthase n=1 Tax=Gimesia panareensis TaxID=2527978 RepID=A0A518FYG7_9PLAN|nr:L-threonylcarbamoyladenylate synthase [Gimesia panareensis]QDV21393.1 Threonylcarbamoyl-AMP synthase [Gimesia panareensis]
MKCNISQDVTAAAELLHNGELVAFATETVYGLGANALNPEAVARIFEVKQRPHFDPLIVHIAAPEQLSEFTTGLSAPAQRLAERFWPGPLTLVLPKRNVIPDLVTSGLDSVAIRIPAHPIARELLQITGLPIAAPSANKFGCLSPTLAQHVVEQLGDEIPMILEGGPCQVGVESTVIQCTEESTILLRPGGIALEEIESCVETVRLARIEDFAETKSQVSPGMLPRHYAPGTRLFLIEKLEQLPSAESIGVLSLYPIEETILSGREFAVQEILSPSGDLKTAAAKLFSALRNLDQSGVECIVALKMPETGLGRTINNRLERAAY